MLVPSPVLAELQGLADAGDDLRRSKGRRGLEVLEALKREPGVDVEVLDLEVPGVAEVDAKLVRICLDRGAALLTLDTNLAKAAALAGVRVLNLHALALALRPPVAAGDEVPVLLLKAGQGARAGGRLPRRRLDGRRRAGPRARRPRGAGRGHQRAHHRQRPAGLRPAGRRGRASAPPAVPGPPARDP
jgi:rRNA-processing protein FCF1